MSDDQAWLDYREGLASQEVEMQREPEDNIPSAVEDRQSLSMVEWYAAHPLSVVNQLGADRATRFANAILSEVELLSHPEGGETCN